MEREYFTAVGYVPRSQSEAAARQELLTWLTGVAQHRGLRGRRPFPPSPWQWSETITPQQVILYLPAGGPIVRDVEQKLWNFMEIPCSVATRRGSTKGWVTLREVIEAPAETLARGEPGGPFRPAEQPATSHRHLFYEAVRCLPENSTEAADWGYTFENRTQWEVILRESRRYNMTLRDRLTSGYSAGRAHASAVSALSAESGELLRQAMYQIALAGASAQGMSLSCFGDLAGSGHRELRPGGTLGTHAY